MNCACLSAWGDEVSEHDRSTQRLARKEHKCCECESVIPRGQQYQHDTLFREDGLSVYKTCLTCQELRKHFGANGWVYTWLWSDLQDCLFPTLTAGGPCLEGLSAAAKAKLFEQWRAWKGLAA